jgi:hypothetical protein
MHILRQGDHGVPVVELFLAVRRKLTPDDAGSDPSRFALTLPDVGRLNPLSRLSAALFP